MMIGWLPLQSSEILPGFSFKKTCCSDQNQTGDNPTRQEAGLWPNGGGLWCCGGGLWCQGRGYEVVIGDWPIATSTIGNPAPGSPSKNQAVWVKTGQVATLVWILFHMSSCTSSHTPKQCRPSDPNPPFELGESGLGSQHACICEGGGHPAQRSR